MDTAFCGAVAEDDCKESRDKDALEPLIDPVLFQKIGFDRFRAPVDVLPDCTKVPLTIEDGQPVIWLLH